MLAITGLLVKCYKCLTARYGSSAYDNPVAVYLMVEAMHHVPDYLFVPSGSLPPDSGIARGGPRGPWHPTLLLNVLFSN